MFERSSSHLYRKAPLLEGVRRAAKAARRMYAAIDPDPRHRMTATQAFYVDHLVRHSQLTVTELAELTHVTVAGASQMVTRLEKRGFVKRRPSLWDARGIIVAATAHGRWALGIITNALTSAEQAWASHLGQPPPHQAITALRGVEAAQVSQFAARGRETFAQWWHQLW